MDIPTLSPLCTIAGPLSFNLPNPGSQVENEIWSIMFPQQITQVIYPWPPNLLWLIFSDATDLAKGIGPCYTKHALPAFTWITARCMDRKKNTDLPRMELYRTELTTFSFFVRFLIHPHGPVQCSECLMFDYAKRNVFFSPRGLVPQKVGEHP